jgi:hypothetical protein
MAKGATFLGGAKSRLLPASVPFRFFFAATAFQLVAWLLVIAGAGDLPSFAGGLGWPPAALHAVTLGVLVMTAIGASLQLLPVATRQPVTSGRAPALLWWLFTPGVAVVVASMALASPIGLGAGALAVIVALAGYALLLGRNLIRGRGMPVVVAHGWAALASLLLLLASAASLVLAYLGVPWLPRQAALGLHVAFAAYGFMGLLVLGFSFILVPMFAVGDSPEPRPALLSLALAAAGLLLAALAAFDFAPTLTRSAAIACGALGFGLHVALMRRVLRAGLRQHLGRPLVLVRIGWAGIAASLAAAVVVWLDLPLPGPALFGTLLAGSLLSILLGMLARIVPFLASMHAVPGRRGPPMPSTLSAERPLAIGFGAHLAALATLLVAVLADSAVVAAAAGVVGAIGALAWIAFVAFAWRRTRAATQDLR